MTNVTEKWLPVAGYEGLYEISNLGRLKSLKKILKLKGNHTLIYEERIMKLKVSETRRYYQVKLYKEAVYKYWFIHRLVAFHFIENVQNKPQINHKNGIKTDNRVENLEWCTNQENITHSVVTGLKRITKVFGKTGDLSGVSKSVICTRTNKRWGSISLAAKDMGINQGTLSWNLRNQHKNKTTLVYENK